eukprot:3013932-Pleurochrysis_carterae.AAC.3
MAKTKAIGRVHHDTLTAISNSTPLKNRKVEKRATCVTAAHGEEKRGERRRKARRALSCAKSSALRCGHALSAACERARATAGTSMDETPGAECTA